MGTADLVRAVPETLVLRGELGGTHLIAQHDRTIYSLIKEAYGRENLLTGR